MDWKIVLISFALLYHADGFSKYGRTCKDIGCLNSEVCVLAEDPCSFGHASNCGTYPTCKKKSLVEGSHSEPSKPTMPKPQTPSRGFDSAPNYKPPVPPNNDNSPYGGGSFGNSHTGGNSPYGSSSGGGNSPYGGQSPYGGSSNGGGSPYGGSPLMAGAPLWRKPPYGGSPPYGGNPPYGGSSNRGGSTYGGSTGSGGGSPIDSILNTLNKYTGGGGGATGGTNGGGLSNVFGNILGDLSKGGGLSNIFNTRPIMENPNYSSYSSNSRSSNPQSNPSGYQPNQNKNYGQSYVPHNRATTRKPVRYGWNFSATVVLTYLIQQYVLITIRN